MQTEIEALMPSPPEGHEWWVMREPTFRGGLVLRVQLRDNSAGEQRIVDHALAELTFIHSKERAVAEVVEAAQRVLARVADTSKQEAMIDSLIGVYGRKE